MSAGSQVEIVSPDRVRPAYLATVKSIRTQVSFVKFSTSESCKLTNVPRITHYQDFFSKDIFNEDKYSNYDLLASACGM